MKKIQIFYIKIEALTELFKRSVEKEIIDNWMSSEEYKFIEKNSTSIEKVEIPNHDRFETIIFYYAVMDEQIETFWRLKFK
jgi:hypothetical protein